MTDAELDHRAEVARIDGNYLALELIRELRQARTRVESMAAVVAAAVDYQRMLDKARRAHLIAGWREYAQDTANALRAALDGYRGAK